MGVPGAERVWPEVPAPRRGLAGEAGDGLELLKLMIKTGMGLELGLLDDTEYADMLRYVAILSQSWAIKPEKVML